MALRISRLPQLAMRALTSNVKNLLYPDGILALWWMGEKNNWGDALNPVLISLLSKKRTIPGKYVINYKNKPIYLVCGSILEMCDRNAIEVWGAGYISERSRAAVRPKAVHAVRGPLTRDMLIRQGVDCPEVYGDPALLYRNYYRPKIPKRYRLGVIPHYIDGASPLLRRIRSEPDVLIIDICSGINQVVDSVCSCRNIASSSLHGLIIADSYGIPSVWMKISGGVVGEGFKFRDYFASVGREDSDPLILTEKEGIDGILDSVHAPRPDIDLKELLEACPFLP
ncbi:MAG TPA: polysaccharide pyruvyl transferase family protein [Methanomicrobiales archaeon]|nr:polysaccharide pyruvyl transferase family protein [Methanomicrobiales archaeon]